MPVPTLAVGVTVGVLLAVLALGAVFIQFVPVGLWVNARAAGVGGVSPATLIGMRLCRVPQDRVVLPLIAAVKAGVDVTADQFQTHFMAGGRVDRVAQALISAHRAQIPLSFEQAAAIDLAGRDVLEAVQVSVSPKVLETPVVIGVARNGVEMQASARVTVRTNMAQLIGGAGEATVLARVGEGIVSTIGSAPTHKDVMEHPDSISRTVLAKGLDSGTAFEILSIDIAGVTVGRNIGARLQADQAEADKLVAQAKAEGRRTQAVALEQEMQALTQERQGGVVAAQADIPPALAGALRAGRLLTRRGPVPLALNKDFDKELPSLNKHG